MVPMVGRRATVVISCRAARALGRGRFGHRKTFEAQPLPPKSRWCCANALPAYINQIPGIYETMAEALEVGGAEARRRENAHVVHGSDGSIVAATTDDRVHAKTGH